MTVANFIQASDGLIDWLVQTGTTISPKIKLVDLRDQFAGRGVVCQTDIEEDEELFSIPRTSILSASTSGLPAEAREEIDDHPWLMLILAIIYEFQRGSDSPWKPYLDILPEHFDTLMFWSDDELRSLQGSAVLSKIGRAHADKLFQERLVPVLRRFHDDFRVSDLTDHDLLAMCHRFGSTIMAYGFDFAKPSATTADEDEDGWEEDDSETGDTPKGMVPMADMLNADGTRNNARLYYEEDRVVMKATHLIICGEEIFNDYGLLPQADLLRRYGYVTDNYASYDVVEISTELIKETACSATRLHPDAIAERIDYFDTCLGVEDGYDIGHAGSERGQFSEEFAALMNCLAMQQSDFDRLKSRERSPKPVLSVDALHLLYCILVQRATLYPSRIDDVPNTHAMSAQTSHRLAMAEKVIKGEKDVLWEAAHTASDMMNGRKRKVHDFDKDVADARSNTKKKYEAS